MAKYTRNRDSILELILFLMLLFSVIINDLPTQEVLGTLGASPMWLIAGALFILNFFKYNLKISNNYYSKLFIVYLSVTLLISFMQIVYYFIINGTLVNDFGGSLIVKLASAFSYFLIYYFFINVAYAFSKKISFTVYSNIIIFISLLLFISLVIEFLYPTVFGFIHFQMDGYGELGGRLRMFSPEPSMAALTFNVFLISAIAFKRNVSGKIIFTLMLVVGNIFISSKSSIALIVLSILIVFFFSMTLKQKLKVSILILVALVIGGYVAFTIVLPSLVVDINNFTSVATRLVTGMWAVISLVMYPVGEGYGTYTVYFHEPIIMAIKWCEEFSPIKLNFAEIEAMIVTGKYLTAKSGILFAIIQSGFIAIIFFYLIFKRIFRDLNAADISFATKIVLKVAVWYTILSITFAVNIEVLYAFLIPIITVGFIPVKSNQRHFN